MKGRRITWSAEELAWIEACSDLPRSELHALFVQIYNRSDVSADHLKALCSRNGWKTGRTGCFVKGQEPPNKGKPMSAATREKCAATMFRKGNLPHNTKYLGHERVSKDGYVEVSIAETNPHTGFGRRYVLKHAHEWEKLHGPVPEGMCLKNIDGNRQNADPSNWQLIDRALLPSLNGGPWGGLSYDAAPAEVKPALMALAKLRVAKRSAIRRAGE